jgi:hypothetical protein
MFSPDAKFRHKKRDIRSDIPLWRSRNAKELTAPTPAPGIVTKSTARSKFFFLKGIGQGR